MHILSAEDIEDYEEDDVIFCPACENRGYKNRIGPKILMPNEPRPDNYSDLWECPTCGLKRDASQIPKEETIKDAVETQDSPYDDKTVIESIKKRTPNTGKQIAPRGGGKRRKRNQFHHDNDIKEEMRRHGTDNVRVLFDSNPQ
jgi:hypothetical protein